MLKDWGEFEHLRGNNEEGDRGISAGLLGRNHTKITYGRINLKWTGDTSLSQKKRKKSEVGIEIRIMFFHFVPDISSNIEFFYWEIMTFSLKIHKMLVCQNIRL